MKLNDEDIKLLSLKSLINIVCAFANIKTNDLSTIELTRTISSNNTTNYITIQLIVARG